VYLDKIDTSAARMSSLIRDVLSYSQASKTNIDRENVDLGEILDNVKSDFELLIQQKNATLRIGNLPVVKGSKRQIHQLFSNLIGNAIKFTNADPVIEIAHSKVHAPENLSLPAEVDYHKISITDNGIGFEPVYTEQIFQLFGRLHNRNEYGGTGIGLSLCKKIAENHNGTITAESEKGEGSTFTVYLPVV
jgi:signal transduction histidine kinase